MSDANELADDLAEIAADPMHKQHIRRTAESAASTLRANAERIKALEEALEPFDDCLGEAEADLPDDTTMVLLIGNRSRVYILRLRDLRRARAARSNPND